MSPDTAATGDSEDIHLLCEVTKPGNGGSHASAEGVGIYDRWLRLDLHFGDWIVETER